MIQQQRGGITKTELAKRLGVSRASLYYKRKREVLDEEVKKQIEAVIVDNPSYGHKRIAIELQLNKKRIRRIMKRYQIKPTKRTRKKPNKVDDVGKEATNIPNYLLQFCPVAPCIVWVSDFTYIRYQEKFIYLATVMDLYTREIVGWYISRYHTKELVLGALEDAVKRTGRTPVYIHSDQGSEYDSQEYRYLVEKLKINMSMSHKSSPWQNGHQESYYGKFKIDLGRTDQFETLGELVEGIHGIIHYYNTKRIHTTLKMAPNVFKENYYKNLSEMRGMTV